MHAVDTVGKRERLGEEHDRPKQLVCTSKSNPIFVVIPSSTVDLPSLSAPVDGNLEVHAQMDRRPTSSSTLDYDGKLCKLTKLPK